MALNCQVCGKPDKEFHGSLMYHSIIKAFVCSKCFDEVDVQNGIKPKTPVRTMVAYCDRCGEEFMFANLTKDDDGHFYCKGCSPTRTGIVKMSVMAAMGEYVDKNGKNSDRLTPIYGLMTRMGFRPKRGLQVNPGELINHMGIIKMFCTALEIRAPKMIGHLYKLIIAEEAAQAVYQAHLEIAFKGLEAKINDAEMKRSGGVSNHYNTYIRDLEGVFCTIVDDKVNLPFA